MIYKVKTNTFTTFDEAFDYCIGYDIELYEIKIFRRL